MSAQKRRVTEKIYICVLFLFISSCMLSGCITDAKYQRQYIGVFDTVVQIIGYEGSRGAFDKNAELIYNKLCEYHRLFDIYNTYDGINNIKTVNDNAGVSSVKVDYAIIELLELSIEMYNITEGRLNVAMGGVLSLWHEAWQNAQNGENIKFPNRDELKKAYEHCNINNIVINKEESTVYLSDGQMSIDVGAVAKGFAVEKVYEYASTLNISSYLLNVGGNVRTFGKKADGGEWNIGIDDPFANGTKFSVRVSSTSVVTSGGYNRYFVYNGKKYNHIIDTKTLQPSEYCASVTVICEDSGRADALSTAFFNMLPYDGVNFAESMDGVEVCYITNDGKLLYTDGFVDIKVD